MDFFVKHWKVNRSGMLMMLAFQLGLFLMGGPGSDADELHCGRGLRVGA